MPHFAERTELVQESPTLATLDKVAELKRRGVDIFNFSNRPSPPPAAVHAAQRAIEETWSFFYTDSAGLPALRKLLAARGSRSLKRQIDPGSEVLITAGGKEAVFAFLMATVGPGDEVLLLDPSWVSYEPCVQLAGGHLTRVPMQFDSSGFRLDVSALRRSLTPRTKVLILNTPHNPTGIVLSKAELQEVADLARMADLFVLADEAYEHYVYDGLQHTSIASLPDMFERTLTISTASKIFNMFGWRLGWAIGPTELMRRLLSIHQNVIGCVTSFVQAGGIGLLSLSEDEFNKTVAATVQTYGAARDVLVNGLNKIAGVSCHKPQGGYLAFPNISGLKRTSAQVSEILLEGGVHSVAGSAFGPNGEGFIRINYSCKPEDAAIGVERIRKALGSLVRA